MRALGLALLCAYCLHASAAGAKPAKGGADVTASPAPSSATSAQHGGGRRPYVDPRQAPPLDPQRKVVEQDCTKPLLPSGGNLKCK